MSYTKTLTVGEYRNIFELATQFKGELPIKLAALRISEKISKAAFDNSVINDKGEKDLPTTITVDLEKQELEGYWKGIVGYLSDSETSIEKVIIVKAICQALGMSGRFTKLESSLSVTEDETPLD